VRSRISPSVMGRRSVSIPELLEGFVQALGGMVAQG
jgi:hypothetical protein